MPKRRTNQNKKRKNKKGKDNKSKSGNIGYNNSNHDDFDFDALIEQQINESNNLNNSNQSHSSIASMLQSKIAEIESSQKRQQNAALFRKNVILQQMNMMKQQYENKQNNLDSNNNANSNHHEQHRQELYNFIQRINDIFYDVLDSENTLKSQTPNLIQQNDTLKKLCKKLQDDKKILNKNLDDIENREKTWRNEIEGKFQNSLSEIRDKIGDHEQRYNSVVDENKKLREQLQQFLEYDKKRSNDFDLYKEHQSKLDEIHEKEKEHFTMEIQKEKAQSLQLTNNLKQAIEINELLKQRCNEYESKFGEMGKTVKESSKCIDEYKKMNIELMKQNKQLHKKLNDMMSKYKQLNSYNDQLDVKNLKSAKRIETLSELCRKLQVKNKDLSDDLKMAKTILFNQGITLQFKSDIKESSSPKKKQESHSQTHTPSKPKVANKAMDVKAKQAKTKKSDDEDDNERDEEDDAPNTTEINKNDADEPNMQITITKEAASTIDNDETVDSKHEEEPLDIEPSPQPKDHEQQNDNDILAESTSTGVAKDTLIDDAELNEDQQEMEKEKNADSEQAATF